MAFGSQLGSFEQARSPRYLNPQVECWDFLGIFLAYKVCGELVYPV